MTRLYTFEVYDTGDERGLGGSLLDAPKASTPNDMRIIIALCCSLVLRHGVNIDPEIEKCLAHILKEIGLIEQRRWVVN